MLVLCLSSVTPLGDIISVLFNVTIVPLILYLLLRKAEKRPIFFDWLITISSSLFVCFGTVLRVHLISGNEWGAIADISRSTVKYYFTQSLASWIACIILDGRLTLNLCRAYQKKKLLASRPTPMQVLEFFGLFTSFFINGQARYWHLQQLPLPDTRCFTPHLVRFGGPV